ncbi:hypothetical protein V5740_12400 [Croceibacterium sp. TMG7-5b_MA50]|uniref:hypothetical protein n=1 Tax=Croceibacterium sp. TMG7-5b_MA50 TaxID=3121290 RepID=UPI003221B099
MTVLAFATAITGVPAAAQNLSGMNSAYNSAVELQGLGGSGETPTMRAIKLERARALYAEAAALLELDGGTLTPEHETYIRDKACDIMGGARKQGNFLATSGCGRFRESAQPSR